MVHDFGDAIVRRVPRDAATAVPRCLPGRVTVRMFRAHNRVLILFLGFLRRRGLCVVGITHFLVRMTADCAHPNGRILVFRHHRVFS